jgi:hypothetical protein
VVHAVAVGLHQPQEPVGDIGDIGRRADLVGDHRRRLPLPRGVQHELREGLAPHPVEPRDAHNIMPRAQRLHRRFAEILGAPVDAERVRRVVLVVRRAFRAVEHIVGGDVDAHRADALTVRGDDLRAEGVHPIRLLRVVLAGVYMGHRGAVDDHIGAEGVKGGAYQVGVGNVHRRVIAVGGWGTRRAQCIPARCATLAHDFCAQQARRARDEYAHLLPPEHLAQRRQPNRDAVDHKRH